MIIYKGNDKLSHSPFVKLKTSLQYVVHFKILVIFQMIKTIQINYFFNFYIYVFCICLDYYNLFHIYYNNIYEEKKEVVL